MSRAPRPHRYPSMMSPPNGRWRQSWLTVVTTSTWPCIKRGGPSPRPFTRATRLGRPGSLAYRAHSMCASTSRRSMSSTAMRSSPGGFVVSSWIRSRASSTTNGSAVTNERLADRRQLEAPIDCGQQERMAVESRVRLAHELHLGPDLIDERRSLERLHRLVGHSVLSRAQQLPHPPYPHVLLGELEPVVDAPHQLEPTDTRLRRVVGEQEAVALGGAAPDAASELMQLGETETVRPFDHHHGGVWNVDADLDDCRGHQDLDLARHEAPHHVVLFLQAPVDQRHGEVGEDVFAQPLELCRRGTRHDFLRLLDERTDHEGLAPQPHLRPDQLVGARPLVGRHHLGLDRRAPWRQLVDHRHGHLAEPSERERTWDRRGGHGEEMRPATTLCA